MTSWVMSLNLKSMKTTSIWTRKDVESIVLIIVQLLLIPFWILMMTHPRVVGICNQTPTITPVIWTQVNQNSNVDPPRPLSLKIWGMESKLQASNLMQSMSLLLMQASRRWQSSPLQVVFARLTSQRSEALRNQRLTIWFFKGTRKVLCDFLEHVKR